MVLAPLEEAVEPARDRATGRPGDVFPGLVLCPLQRHRPHGVVRHPAVERITLHRILEYTLGDAGEDTLLRHFLCGLRTSPDGFGLNELAGERLGRPGHREVNSALGRLGGAGASEGSQIPRREELEHESRGGTHDVTDRRAERAVLGAAGLGHRERSGEGLLVRDLLALLQLPEGVGSAHGGSDGAGLRADKGHEREVGGADVGDSLPEIALLARPIAGDDREEPLALRTLHEPLAGFYESADQLRSEDGLSRPGLASIVQELDRLLAGRVKVDDERIPVPASERYRRRIL